MSKNVPPHIILNSSKEVIFYISNNSQIKIDKDLWLQKLELHNYKVMIINSECIFNRLKENNYCDIKRKYK